jgi:hypothetical protein
VYVQCPVNFLLDLEIFKSIECEGVCILAGMDLVALLQGMCVREGKKDKSNEDDDHSE